jgi:putative CocE/NonD family hydrolase
VELPFFEFYLKDKGEMKLPEATVFETGSNRWTEYDTWPPKFSRPVKFFFHEGGKLSPAPPPGAEKLPPAKQMDEYVSDPSKPVPYTEDVHLNRTREYMCDDQRFAARRPDVLVYQTEVLTEPVTVTGTVGADLWVSLSSTDADFVVKLIDVFPDTLKGRENGVPLGGYQMLVRGEIMRGRYRNGFDKPQPFVPGTITPVRFDLPDVAHTFLPGHKIMVQVQSSWFPLADRNPQQYIDIYHAKDEDFVPANVQIFHTPLGASGVVLPVMRR